MIIFKLEPFYFVILFSLIFFGVFIFLMLPVKILPGKDEILIRKFFKGKSIPLELIQRVVLSREKIKSLIRFLGSYRNIGEKEILIIEISEGNFILREDEDHYKEIKDLLREKWEGADEGK